MTEVMDVDVWSSGPLEPGDRFESVAEFERRRGWLNGGSKAELLDGVVYVTPPAPDDHGQPHATWAGLLFAYRAVTPGVLLSVDQVARPAPLTSVGPDVVLVVAPEAGGLVRRSNGAWEGPLDLVVEVARTSRSYDLHTKRDVYERGGVREYFVHDAETGDVHAWRLGHDSRFAAVAPDPDGVLRSAVFPGLWVDTDAVRAADGARLLATLQRGLASAEHARFVATQRAALAGGSQAGG